MDNIELIVFGLLLAIAGLAVLAGFLRVQGFVKSVGDFLDVCARAELFLVRAVPPVLWRDAYLLPRLRAFIDADPGA